MINLITGAIRGLVRAAAAKQVAQSGKEPRGSSEKRFETAELPAGEKPDG